MPRIHMPDGTVLEAPYDIPRDQLRAWADAEMEKRSRSKGPTAEQLSQGGPSAMGAASGEQLRENLGAFGTGTLAGASVLAPGALPAAASGAARTLGLGARFVTHPATLGTIATGTSLAAGQGVPQAIGHGLTVGLLGRAGRFSAAGRRFDTMLRKSAERFGRPAAKAAEGALEVPGRTLTKPSAPPFMPKGKMRLDLGPREQTTMTGTVETARPLTPKPQFSSTGAVPRGKVTQPNVRVRAEGSMDPAKQGPATASGPVTPRSTPAGKPAAPAAPRAETPPAADDDVGAYIERTVRDTGLSKRQIIDAVQIRYGATHEQARTAVDAIFGLKGLTRR